MNPEKCACGLPGEPSFFETECVFCSGMVKAFDERWAPIEALFEEYIEKTKEYGDV